MQHSSSIIDPSAVIHESVEIGPFCLIGPGVEIDAETKIESHVILKGPTKIGKRTADGGPVAGKIGVAAHGKSRREKTKMKIVASLGEKTAPELVPL